MRVIMYGKPDCKNCDAAEAKLQKMGIDYIKHNLQELQQGVSLPDKGTRPWKELVAAGVQWALGDEFIPVFVIDGEPVSYPAAMKACKALFRAQRAQGGPEMEEGPGPQKGPTGGP